MDFQHLISLQNLIFLTGLLHFCQLPAMVAAPRMLGWAEDLAKLQVMNRRIVKVIGLGIMVAVLGLGVVVITSAHDLASGSRLALATCLFLSVFWVYRGIVQVTVYTRVWPKSPLGRLSHVGLSLLFFFLTASYLFAYIVMLVR